MSNYRMIQSVSDNFEAVIVDRITNLCGFYGGKGAGYKNHARRG